MKVLSVPPRMAVRTGFLALALLSSFNLLQADSQSLVVNPSFIDSAGYTLHGDATYRSALGNPQLDTMGAGIVFSDSGSGTISQSVTIDPKQGRSFRFRIRGLAQDGFKVAENGLYLEVQFFSADGKTAYDGKTKQLYPIIEQARKDLTVNGNLHTGGAAAWRDYDVTFYVPFPQVGQIRLTVTSTGSSAFSTDSSSTPSAPLAQTRTARRGAGLPPKKIDTGGSAFLINNFSLTRLPEPADLLSKPTTETTYLTPGGQILPLGGRWFYLAKTGETQAPAVFNEDNSDRLLYRDGPDGSYETPFAHNMSATLHAGDVDLAGNTVAADRPVPDNVTVRFDAKSMIIHTHGLPNHPTGKFPEEGFRANPNAITEQDETFYLPLKPEENPGHVALQLGGSTSALNMGPIGVATNGVVFFNPFDADQMDASNAMDRCCGHPNRDGQYHYHKYPICLNSPWADEGNGHSPLIGWAFDGYPVYGPYESKDVMAKDVTGASALNAFNLHYDAQRGWHYHVTPGKFPYLIGGYWGTVDARDVHPLRDGGGPGGGPGGGGRDDGPGGFPPPQ